jgi:uncharacterized protein
MRLEAANSESLESNKPSSVAWQQLVVSYGITTIAAWIFGFLLFEGQSDSHRDLIYRWNMWSPTLSIIAVLIVWPKSWRSILRDIGIIGGTIRSIFLYILMAVIVYPLVILTAPFILSLFGWYKLDLQNFSGLKELLTQAGTEDSVLKSLPPFIGALFFMWQFFSINLFSVLGEECAWRGFILNRLLPLGQKKAVLISGVLWGVWMQPVVLLGRAYFPSQPILGGLIMMMTAILIGVVFGWLRLASGSIWPSVCAHSANAAAYHACGFFGAAKQTNTWPGTMLVGVFIPLIFLIAFLIWTKRFPVEDRSLKHIPA